MSKFNTLLRVDIAGLNGVQRFELESTIASLIGGCSVTEKSGSYANNDGGLVMEDSLTFEVFCERYQTNWLVPMFEASAKSAGQESIGVLITDTNYKLIFVEEPSIMGTK